jgi:hypothetical protein
LKGGEKVKNRIFLISLVVLLALSVGLIGCTTEYVPEITKHTLTIDSTDGGDSTCVPAAGCTCGEGTESSGGLTVPEECVCAEGIEVSIEATPDPGYRFIGWIGNIDTITDVNAAKTTITMNDDYSITANFIAQYVLTIDSTDGGDVTTPGEGTFIYDAGAVVDLVAEPEKGYKFLNWTGDVGTIADAGAAMTNITMNSDYSMTANFQPDWIQNPTNGHYYVLTPYLSWMQAEAWAREWGAHLVTLRNWEEELWIKDTFGRNECFWVGFSDIEEEGNWVWSSGEYVVYTNWEEGEPNNCGDWPETGVCNPEDAAVMNWAVDGFGNYWNDLPSDLPQRGVAEIASIPG